MREELEIELAHWIRYLQVERACVPSHKSAQTHTLTAHTQLPVSKLASRRRLSFVAHLASLAGTHASTNRMTQGHASSTLVPRCPTLKLVRSSLDEAVLASLPSCSLHRILDHHPRP